MGCLYSDIFFLKLWSPIWVVELLSIKTVPLCSDYLKEAVMRELFPVPILPTMPTFPLESVLALRSFNTRGPSVVYLKFTLLKAMAPESHQRWTKLQFQGHFFLRCHAKLLQSCPTLCDPMDFSPIGSSVHGILWATILEWVAMPSSRGSSWTKDQTCISSISCIVRRVLYHWHQFNHPFYWNHCIINLHALPDALLEQN